MSWEACTAMLNRLIGRFTRGDKAFFQQLGTNEEFVGFCYREFLGRDVDANSLQIAVQALANGLSRLALIKGLVTSPEFLYGLLGHYFPKAALPNLTQEYPERYTMAPVVNQSHLCLTYRAEQPDDY